MHTILALSMALGACATDNAPVLVEDQAALSQPTAKQPVIRSAAELERHLRTTADSPLNRLEPAAREHFLGNLVFTRSGLASFQYSVLEKLSATDAHQILSLFGMERTTSLIANVGVLDEADQAIMDTKVLGADHAGYRCGGPGTCSSAMNYICTSNCVAQ